MEASDELVKKVADNIGKIEVKNPATIDCLRPLNAQLSRKLLEYIARVAIASIPRRPR